MSLLSYFDSVDIFKLPVSLLINEKTKSSTLGGKLFTSIILIYIFVSFFGSDLIQKTNPIIYRQDMKVGDRPKFNFSKEEISLVAGLSDVNNNFEFNDRIFTIKSYLRYYSPLLPDELKTELNLTVCQENDFTDPMLFKKLNLNK
jgi:ABC-type transport system involved in multi-copper enzyme maturation permease subunit